MGGKKAGMRVDSINSQKWRWNKATLDVGAQSQEINIFFFFFGSSCLGDFQVSVAHEVTSSCLPSASYSFTPRWK